MEERTEFREEDFIRIKEGRVSPSEAGKLLENADTATLLSLWREFDRSGRERFLRLVDDKAVLRMADEELSVLSDTDLRRRTTLLVSARSETASAYISSLSHEERRNTLSLLPEEMRENLSRIYTEDEIGSLMTRDFVEMDGDTSRDEALVKLREETANKDNITTIFVIGEGRRLLGEVDLITLLRAKKSEKLKDLAKLSFPYVYDTMETDRAIMFIREYNEALIPVLDEDNRIKGAVTRLDMMEALEEENAEDYRKFASLHGDNDDAGVLKSMAGRLPWLLLLLGLGILVSAVISEVSGLVAGISIVFAFQSLILDMAGNSGTQSLAIAVRVLSRETEGTGKLIWKEMKTCFTAGVILSLIVLPVVFLFAFLLKDQTPAVAFATALAASVALLGAMSLSGFSGAAIPLFFDKIGVDPAVASGPLVTTLNDLVGATVYYLLASLFLSMV